MLAEDAMAAEPPIPLCLVIANSVLRAKRLLAVTMLLSPVVPLVIFY